ncbi:MAG: 50S ribosomal protein L9 [Gammaproteobacteria bacterium]|nr:50S ribosomal protein L9 [Gammaproteobacteria bacterium]MBI5617671.1 50S ribosomal protein L9 [Gammaproteobacteria bacterium]
MEVILLEKIHNLGKLGDKVRVRSGFGRNYLIPLKKAVPATADNIAKFEAQRADLEKAHQDVLSAAEARAAQLADLEVTIAAKSGAEGRLYGSVGTGEIADALAALGQTVEKREVRLANGPIRMLGRHSVDVHLHADVNATVTVVVVSEDAPAAPPAAADEE